MDNLHVYLLSQLCAMSQYYQVNSCPAVVFYASVKDKVDC